MADADEARAVVSISPSPISALPSDAKPRDKRLPVRKRLAARLRESKLLEGRRPGSPRGGNSRPAKRPRASSRLVRSRRASSRRGRSLPAGRILRDSSPRVRIRRGSNRPVKNRLGVKSRPARSRLGVTTRDAITRAVSPTAALRSRRESTPTAGLRIGPAIRATLDGSPETRDGRTGVRRSIGGLRSSVSRIDRPSRAGPTRDAIASLGLIRIGAATIATITATATSSGIRTETIAAAISTTATWTGPRTAG